MVGVWYTRSHKVFHIRKAETPTRHALLGSGRPPKTALKTDTHSESTTLPGRQSGRQKFTATYANAVHGAQLGAHRDAKDVPAAARTTIVLVHAICQPRPVMRRTPECIATCTRSHRNTHSRQSVHSIVELSTEMEWHERSKPEGRRAKLGGSRGRGS